MNIKYLFFLFIGVISLSLSAQTQTWQWVKAGGSSSDNNSVQPAECKIAGCDAYGNVYAVGGINGPNMRFDTFSSAGSYSGTNTNISYLLFSYDCSGNMRWAKQIGDEEGNSLLYGVVTDPQGNTYFAANFFFGYWGSNLPLYLGDSVIQPAPPSVCQYYLCMIKYDSLGRLVWFKNFEEDTAYGPHSNKSGAYGLRIGSSGNLWMACFMDSNYAISPNLHTTKKGLYNVEIDPVSGNILSGYYTSNGFFSNLGTGYDNDSYYDMDENENFYQIGVLNTWDTLILDTQRITPNASQTNVEPFIFSLDKHGNFRYIITDKSYCTNGNFTACKYDFQTSRFVTCWSLNPGDVYGTDTFNFNQSLTGSNTRGLLTLDTNGNILWGKYVTQSNNNGFIFRYVPTAFYTDHILNNGLVIYNNIDTLCNNLTGSSSDYAKVIGQIDQNGNLIATHTAHLGMTGSSTGSNIAEYGATDWRGNVYLGGTVTNYFATPTDSVVNTDVQSGNFFIAKIGISDCSCPTPGVRFTQAVHGDTVTFYGSSLNYSDSIRWRLGDGAVSLTDTFTHLYSNHDSTYTVTAIAYSGCGVDSITKQITITVLGIKTIEPDKTNLYPNPVTNSVYLDVSGPAVIGLVLANGASVWQGPVQVNQQGTYVFDMSKYASALYYFIVQYPNGKTDVMQVVKK